MADTAIVRLTTSATPAPVPAPTPTPVPLPHRLRRRRRCTPARWASTFGAFSLLSKGVATTPYTMSIDGYTAGAIQSRLANARARKMSVILNMTGGAHTQYMTGGRFDLAKWQAKMNTYNTPAIKQAVAAAVADGTIIGNGVMDEPMNTTPTNTWGPRGTMTKAKVDQMCGYVKAMFPTLPLASSTITTTLSPALLIGFATSSSRSIDCPRDRWRPFVMLVWRWPDGTGWASRSV